MAFKVENWRVGLKPTKTWPESLRSFDLNGYEIIGYNTRPAYDANTNYIDDVLNVLVYSPEGRRLLNINGREFYVPLPRTIYKIQLKGNGRWGGGTPVLTNIGWIATKLRTQNDKVYLPSHANVNADARACYYPTMMNEKYHDEPITNQIIHTLNSWLRQKHTQSHWPPANRGMWKYCWDKRKDPKPAGQTNLTEVYKAYEVWEKLSMTKMLEKFQTNPHITARKLLSASGY